MRPNTVSVHGAYNSYNHPHERRVYACIPDRLTFFSFSTHNENVKLSYITDSNGKDLDRPENCGLFTPLDMLLSFVFERCTLAFRAFHLVSCLTSLLTHRDCPHWHSVSDNPSIVLENS